jgi:hypothetical protein
MVKTIFRPPGDAGAYAAVCRARQKAPKTSRIQKHKVLKTVY